MSGLLLKGINKVYPSGVQAVFNFCLDIRDKEFIVYPLYQFVFTEAIFSSVYVKRCKPCYHAAFGGRKVIGREFPI